MNPAMPRSAAMISFACLLLFAFLPSCAGGPEAAMEWRGDMPDGGGSWSLTVGEGHSAEFSWDRLPMAVMAGEAFPESDGSWLFHIDEVRWFEKWVRGWTEAVFSAYGSIRLVPSAGLWRAEISEMPAIESVRTARLRFWDDGYYGLRARDLVERRWMRSRAVADHFREAWAGGEIPGWKEFRDRYREELLPEAYDRKSDRLRGAEEDGVWAEGVIWDTSYTRENFPEELHAVRDSGTLYRDSVEGSVLVYLAWIWPTIWDTCVPESAIRAGVPVNQE